MPDIVCDTSSIQYLHQIELLHLLPALAGRIFIPPAVLHELEEGRSCVLMLAIEMRGVVAVLDDGLARKEADRRGIPVIGTLGLLVNAKRVGLVASVKEQIDRLQFHRFRLSPLTRAAVLKLAGETE